MLNTHAGRMVEEIAFELISHACRRIIFELIPGLFRIIISAFARLLEWVERFFYAVDEWLRFREGQSHGMLAIKAGLGLIWGVAAYAARIYLNLLVEPTINPIKHFPVVTVAAKIMLPFALDLTRIFAAPLTPFLGPLIGNSIAATTVLFLPGVFGFLVWELTSNWRLYESNRPESLGPVVVGSHGETVVRLLRPGFHSGTLPKQFARLRRARRAGREQAALKHRRGAAPRRGIGSQAGRARVRRVPPRESFARGLVDRARIDPSGDQPHSGRAPGRRTRPAQPLDRPGGAIGHARGRDFATGMAGEPEP